MLESASHAYNTFATLTYTIAPPELVPADGQYFIRRLRKIYPAPFRYYLVGEYGTLNLRPHFHVVLFGVSFLDREYVQKAWSLEEDGKLVPRGFVDTQELTTGRAKYIAGYVCKKMTTFTNPALEGKHPEFARMSLKPGIGALQCEQIGKNLVEAFENGHTALDVPGEVRQTGRKMPMGRYLQSRVRTEIGWEPNMPQDAKKALEAERQAMDPALRNLRRQRAYEQSVGRHKNSLLRRKL